MNKHWKRGICLVGLGLCLVLASLGIHLAQKQKDTLAGENATVLLQQLERSRSKPKVTLSRKEAEEETVTEMPEAEYLGYSMIGTVRVPSVGIFLPILSSWSYELLDVAPCRYSGSIPEENMILMGHNYRSHFTPLHQVKVGAEVEFEDVNGEIYRYTVAEIQFVYKNDVEKLASDYPLTLFTCTAGGQNRVLVRCESQ